jgi:hypothetical protein
LGPIVTFDWASAAARLLKAEIAREGITLAALAGRLQQLGVDETEASVKNKLYRGTFSAVFLMQCMHVLGRPRIDLAGVIPDVVPGAASGGLAAPADK